MMRFKTRSLNAVLIWFRVFLRLGQERSTKPYQTAEKTLVSLRVFSWIALSGVRKFLLKTAHRQTHFPTLSQRERERRILLHRGNLSLRTLPLIVVIFTSACSSQGIRRSGMPAGAQTVLDTSIEDIDAGRYEKLYHEAADEWRNDTTLDESKATFQKLHDKLGKVRSRDLQNVREEQTSTAPIAGHSVVALYQTSFEQGSGMETFTLVERSGRWYLARYYVTSNALK
jgi:hypothetical protein